MAEINPSEALAEVEIIASRLIKRSSKGALERAARLLASHVGHYQLRHGVISVADLSKINRLAVSERDITARTEALRVLAAALTLAADAASG